MAEAQDELAAFKKLQEDVLEMVREHAVDTNLVSQLNKYLTILINKKEFDPPLQDETAPFVNQFSPSLIRLILDTDGTIKGVAKPYQSMLNLYVQLLIAIIDRPEFTTYIDEAYDILVRVRCVFYETTSSHSAFLMTDNPSPHYVNNIKTFSSSSVVDTFCHYVSTCKQLDMQYCLVVLRLFRAMGRREMGREAIQLAVLAVTSKIESMIDGMTPEDLRVVNEDEIANIVSCLVMMTQSPDVRQRLNTMLVRVQIALVKSGVLTQQFKAMEALRKKVEASYGYTGVVTAMLKEQGFVAFFLKDIHHSLVKDFVVIFKEMLKNGTATEKDMKDFWMLTVNQHPGLIQYFIKGWNWLINHLQGDKPRLVFRCIAEANQFPDDVLEFVSKNAFRTQAQERKMLFKAISPMYFDESEGNDKEKKLVVNALAALVPRDTEFLMNLQDQCMNMIEKGEDLDYALPLFRASCLDVSPQKAHEHFVALVRTMLSNALDVTQYFDLLVKIMEKLQHPLTEDEFNDIMKLLTPLMQDRLKIVCEFLKRIMDRETSNGSLFQKQFKSKILEKMSSLTDWTDGFSFIIGLFKQLHSSPIEDGVECEDLKYLWRVVFSSSACSYELADYLITLYSDDPIVFIRHCFEKIDCSGSLLALQRLIRYVQDGLELEKIGIEPHVPVPEERMRCVQLTGETDYTITVPKDITYLGFCRRVSATLQKPISELKLRINDQILTATNFRLQEGETVVSWKPYVPSYYYGKKAKTERDTVVSVENIDPAKLPSTIILDQEFAMPLFNLLSSDNPRIAARAGIILDVIPTMPFEMDVFTDFSAALPDWSQLLSADHPYLLIYRTKLISKLIKLGGLNWVQTFFASNGTTLLLRLVLSCESYFTTLSGPLLLLRVTKTLLKIPELTSVINEIYSDEYESAVPKIVEWVIKLSREQTSTEHDLFILELLGVLEDFLKRDWTFAKENSLFVDLLKGVLFSSSASVRREMKTIVNILPAEYHQDLILPLLPLALNKKCHEFFSLLKKVAESTDKTELLFHEIVSVLLSHYKPPDGGVVAQLLFRPPSENYTKGIFKVMNRLVKRMEEIPQSKELFEFLTHSIIFNPLKYYEPTKDLFEVVTALIDRNKELADLIVPELMEMNKSQNYLTVRNTASLNSTATSRGLKNLGATCYMNATLQQLFNIKELRTGILRNHCEEDDWLKEIQFIFAELSYYPSDWIDPRCFVRKWTDWGGEPINPREQQDAVEFLQMFLERMEAKVKGSTSIFQGQIAHTLVARNNEINPIDSTEDFLTLPLEVKGHENVEESLKTFLVPDRFEGSNQYKVDDVGLIDADRYHKIRKAPKILIAQLKRFEYDLQSNTRIKVNSRYTFPMVLDLGPVMENNAPILYDLCGVVMHMGSAMAGHYFSHVKRDDGKWLTLNDCSVKKCNGEQLPETAAGGRTTARYDSAVTYIDKDLNAYLLFYRMRQENASEVGDSVTCTPSMSELADQDDDVDATVQGGMDESVLKRLVESITKAIMTEVMTSMQFTKLLRYLTASYKDGKFIYSFMMNYLRTDISVSSVASLGSQCSDLLVSDRDFADFVLDQKGDFEEFFFAKDANKRGLYCCLFTDALKNASQTAVEAVATSLKDRMSGFVNNFDSFDVLFKVLQTIVTAQPSREQEEWLGIITNFLTGELSEFDSKNKGKNVYLSIDLSAAFNLLRTMFEGVLKDKTDTYARIFVDRSNNAICQWMLSQKHSFEAIELLNALIKDNQEMNAEFLVIFKDHEKDFVPSQFGGFFVTSLRISDAWNQKRDEAFVGSIMKQKLPYVAEVLNDMANRAERFSGALASRFMDPEVIGTLLRSCLCCHELSIREGFQKVVHRFFNRPSEPTPIPEGEDASLPKQLMMVMIDALPKVEQKLPRTTDGIASSEKVFTGTFFKVLEWTIITGRLVPEACGYAKEFIALYKKAVDVSLIRVVSDVLSFLHTLVCRAQSEQFFTNKQMFSKFISVCNNTRLFNKSTSDTRKLLDMIPRAYVGDFVKTDCFRVIADQHFGDQECGGRLSLLIEESLTNDNCKAIMKQLWDANMFYRNTRPVAFHYIRMSWRILAKFPKSSNMFLDNGLHDVLWSNFIKPCFERHGWSLKSEDLRPIAKLLGQFNISFVNENKDKKFKFKGKKVEWLTKHWREEGVNIKDLVDAALVTVPRGRGASGLCVLIKSFITMDISFAKDLLHILSEKKDGFIYRCPSDAQHEAAGLITTLNLQIAAKTDQQAEADSLLVQEFASLSTQSVLSFEVVNDICAQLLAICPRLNETQLQSIAASLDHIYSSTKNPKMMSSSISLIAHKLPFGNYENWLANAVRLLSAEITAGLAQTEAQLAATGANICTLLDFLTRMSGDHSLAIPKPSVQSGAAFQLATRFQQIEAIDSSDAALALTKSLSLFDT